MQNYETRKQLFLEFPPQFSSKHSQGETKMALDKKCSQGLPSRFRSNETIAFTTKAQVPYF